MYDHMTVCVVQLHNSEWDDKWQVISDPYKYAGVTISNMVLNISSCHQQQCYRPVPSPSTSWGSSNKSEPFLVTVIVY